MTAAALPLVTIGMPVYNGERYLRGALAALLAQDYSRFELVISDNGSADSTEVICREFQSFDSRIRYVRQPENRGPAWNFAFVVQEARGEYFMWAAHDDLWAPGYIRKCLATLQAHQGAVLCCTEIDFIDAAGARSAEWEKKTYRNIDTLGMNIPDRIHELINRIGWFAIYGLMRLEAIRKTSFERISYGADVLLLFELLLQGDFVKVPELLFRYRIAKSQSAPGECPDRPYQNAEGPPTEAAYSGLAVSLLDLGMRSKLSPSDQTRIFADFIVTLSLWNPYWRRRIHSELLPHCPAPDDLQFASLLFTALSRTIPLAVLKQNSLFTAMFSGAGSPPPLLETAARLRRESGVFVSLHEDTYQEGRRLFRKGRFEEASQLLLAALKQLPTSDRWSDWGTARLACNQPAEAELGFRRALDLNYDNDHAALRLGYLLAASGQGHDAVFLLERGLRALPAPEHPEVLQLIHQCRGRLSAPGSPSSVPAPGGSGS
jgi:glycosyltransferase involved in cell wall biosynthesis